MGLFLCARGRDPLRGSSTVTASFFCFFVRAGAIRYT
jgi:hypothetical protein